MVIGILLLRRGGPGHGHGGRLAGIASATADTAAAPIAAPHSHRCGRAATASAPRSPLGWYITAATLIAIGVAALLERTSDLALLPGQFFGLALTVIGAGLLIGSWWGRARVLILPALLVLLLGLPAAFMTVPLEGGVGGPYFAPTRMEELRR